MSTQRIKTNSPFTDMVQGKRVYTDAKRISEAEHFVAITDKTKHLEELSSLKNLETLWVGGLKQKQVPAIAECVGLRTLCVRGTRSDDFSEIASLKNLEVLIISESTRINNLSFVAGMRELQAIFIWDMPKLTSIEPLRKLDGLQELYLSGGIWNKLVINSLEPLRKLNNLRYLSLGTHIEEQSLEPLSQLTDLVETHIHGKTFPMEEYAKLQGKLLKTKFPYLEELMEHFPHRECRKCKEQTMYIPIGKGTRMLCRICDKKKIDEQITRFEQIVEESRSSKTW